MSAPAFWWRAKPTLLATLLRPLGAVYGGVTARRMRRPGERASLPVICIGNFTAGGAGKTPTALALADLLIASGETPAFLSRGYGGRLSGPIRVEKHHRAEDVGDEPLLLSRKATAIVSRSRPPGARLAQESGASVIIMDDGLQNTSLRKDLAVAVVDGATGIGNGLPVPAGPLRARLETQWPIVDAVLMIGRGTGVPTIAQEAQGRGKPVFFGILAPDAAAVARLRNRRVLAFAGIGRPDKFFETLRACGATVEETRSFPDHHSYNAQELAGLRREARQRGLQLVTTEKDMARIGGLDDVAAGDIATLPVSLSLEDNASWRNLVLSSLLKRRSEDQT